MILAMGDDDDNVEIDLRISVWHDNFGFDDYSNLDQWIRKAVVVLAVRLGEKSGLIQVKKTLFNVAFSKNGMIQGRVPAIK